MNQSRAWRCNKIKLFCLPYAGGSSEVIYKKWRSIIPENFIVIPIELPGRSSRIRERLCLDIDALIIELKNEVYNNISYNENYAIIGHSMGALIAFLLAIELEKEKKVRRADKVFILGKNSPNKAKIISEELFEEAELKKYLKSIGGSTNSILESDIYFKYFSEIIISDFRLINSIKLPIMPSNNNIINSPIIYIGGLNDIRSQLYEDWNLFTNSYTEYYTLEGDHFFINDNYQSVIDIIINELQ